MAKRFVSPFVVAVMLAAASVTMADDAKADSTLSAQQIKDALLPGGRLPGGLTRGIKPPSAAGTPTGATPTGATPTGATSTGAVAKAAADENPPSVDLSIQFATGSDELTPQAVTALNELGKALTTSELTKMRFRIEGHTDTTGTKAENLALSDRRAAAVVQYLSKNFSVDPMRLDAVGKGEQDLLIPTPDQTPEPRNRRVRVVNLGG